MNMNNNKLNNNELIFFNELNDNLYKHSNHHNKLSVKSVR